jgi:hypothetical protein
MFNFILDLRYVLLLSGVWLLLPGGHAAGPVFLFVVLHFLTSLVVCEQLILRCFALAYIIVVLYYVVQWTFLFSSMVSNILL